MSTFDFKSLQTLAIDDSVEGLLVINLNRPKAHNAFSSQMIEEWGALLNYLETAFQHRVCVVQGNARMFSAGLDLSELDLNDPKMATMGGKMQVQQRFSKLFIAIRRVPQVFVAVVQGPAVGAGMALALACDIRFVAPKAKFGVAMRKIGFGGLDLGISYQLPRLVGSAIAAELMYTGNFIDAKRSVDTGLANYLYENEEVQAQALKFCKKMLTTSPLGLWLTKEGLNRSIEANSIEQAVHMEDRQQVMCLASGDVEAGVMAFLTKSPPKYSKL